LPNVGNAESLWALNLSGGLDEKTAMNTLEHDDPFIRLWTVRLLADHCDLYNAALEERREAWRMRQVPVTFGTQSAQLKDIRAADRDGQGRHSFTAQQQTLRRLGVVFQGFYDRCRAGQQPGYPRFKPPSRITVTTPSLVGRRRISSIVLPLPLMAPSPSLKLMDPP